VLTSTAGVLAGKIILHTMQQQDASTPPAQLAPAAVAQACNRSTQAAIQAAAAAVAGHNARIAREYSLFEA